MRSYSKPMLALAAMLAMILAAGCAAGPESGQTRTSAMDDGAGPRALLATWHKTLVAGDKSAYTACFIGTDEEIVLALAGMEAVQANYAFHDAVVTKFGADAWKGFSSGGAQIDIFPKDPMAAQRITVVQTGGTAQGYLPRGKVPLTMVERGGRWYIHAASMTPPGLKAKEAADYQYRWAAALRKLTQQVASNQTPAPAAASPTEDFMKMVAPEERARATEAVGHATFNAM
jgi:hypothetical protein